MGKVLAITSMYANPIHPGHIECLEKSKQIADKLWVIVNNDYQAKLKRGTESFQDEKFRAKIVESIKYVDKVFIAKDKDLSVVKTLEELIQKAIKSGEFEKIIFTKGGDRFANEIPERKICEKYNVKIVDGLGEKIYSSSDLIKNIANKDDLENIKKDLSKLPEEFKEKRYLEIGKRPWGLYYVLEEGNNYKVKKIIVEPGKRLSLQSHKYRSEHWVVVNGQAIIEFGNSVDNLERKVLYTNESFFIRKKQLHRLSNKGEELLVVIEVQSGEYLGEDDIIRYKDDWNRE